MCPSKDVLRQHLGRKEHGDTSAGDGPAGGVCAHNETAGRHPDGRSWQGSAPRKEAFGAGLLEIDLSLFYQF